MSFRRLAPITGDEDRARRLRSMTDGELWEFAMRLMKAAPFIADGWLATHIKPDRAATPHDSRR